MFDSVPFLEGWGSPSDAPQLSDLMKALTSGYTFGVTDQKDGAALRVESLESTLRTLTFSADHVRFWKAIPKMPAYSTVEEYNVLNAYGSNASSFIPEGVLPETEDTNYARNVALIKFLGTTRIVSHQATLVRNAHGDVIALENRNGVLFLMQQIERNLFWGNNQLVYNYQSSSGGNEGIEWAGLDAQIASTSYIDAQGGSLTEGLLNDATELVAQNYGRATTVFGSFKSISDFSKSYYSRERILVPNAEGFTAGVSATKFSSPFGPVDLIGDVFLNKQRKSKQPDGIAPSSATSPNAPQPPATVAGAVTVGAGLWKALNTVSYKVSACNRYGESAATAITAAVSVTAATDIVTLTITNPNPISGLTPDFFNVYRSDDGGNTYWYVGSQAAGSISSAGTTTFVDNGLYMTQVSTVFVGELDPMVIAMKQLAPLMKMDLAVLGPAIRWMILFYGTPVLYQPLKWVKIINIGDAA